MSDSRAFLETLFRAAVAAAHPAACLPPLLPQPPAGRIILLAAGKAAGAMAQVAENFYLHDLKFDRKRFSGVAVARHGYGRPLQSVVSAIALFVPMTRTTPASPPGDTTVLFSTWWSYVR